MKIFIPLLISFFLLNCNSKNKGQECADIFFQLIVNEKFESAANMLSDIHPNDTNNIKMLEDFRNNSGFGELISAEKNFGFKTESHNGITSVVLPYNFKYQDGKKNSNVRLIDNGTGFKISSID